MTRQRNGKATRQAIFDDHGGELRFWLGWVQGEIDGAVRERLRGQARRDPALQQDIDSLDVPAARRDVRLALEATGYLTPRGAAPPPAADDGDDVTNLVLRDRPAAPLPPPGPQAAPRIARRSAAATKVYRRIGRSLFKLLEEVEIPLPARDEAGEATRLLQHLVGREALGRFRDLTGWLRDTRARMDLAGDPAFFTARDRLLFWLTPECFLTDGRRSHFELSFRLFLRARWKDYCRQKDWRPAGPRYGDLESAFRGLDRQRIGDLVREAAREAVRAEEEAPDLVGLPLAQALQWLEVAP